ncbi:hypothetical protein [Hyphococcus sp.]|uniref:hypothetical protein n=1 Tax=Hyphococcus sp. TaxID=2038636 RepID=UPI0035C67F61
MRDLEFFMKAVIGFEAFFLRRIIGRKVDAPYPKARSSAILRSIRSSGRTTTDSSPEKRASCLFNECPILSPPKARQASDWTLFPKSQLHSPPTQPQILQHLDSLIA